jgi:hypothetical protein
MKRVFLYLAMAALLLTGCYKDEIDDLNKRVDDLKTEQERQAGLLANYRTLLDVLEKKLTVSSLAEVDGGYKIVFSNGTEMLVKNGETGHTPLIAIGENGNWFIDGADTGKKSAGENGSSPTLRIEDNYWYLNDVNTGVKAAGQDGDNAPYIVSIVDVGGVIVFYMSDGSTITVGKTATVGLYVLSEGTMGGGNGQLAYFDYNTATGKFVRNNDKRFQNYGETPNDLIIYGSRMYCAITGTMGGDNGLVRVVNPATGETVSEIVITKESARQQPRRLTATGGKVYVTLYSGAVAQIDTASYNFNVAGLSGTFSDGICTQGQSLYICNSGQGAGNTISVVDIASFTETETITVPYNPVNIVNAGNGELYINTLAVYSGPAAGEPANVHVLNPATKQVTKTLDVAVESIAAGKDYVYGAVTDWDSYGSLLKKIAIADKSVSDFTADAEDYMLGYKLSVNPIAGEVFLTQQMGQDIVRFKEDGTYIETLKAGQQNGAAVAFVNTVRQQR